MDNTHKYKTFREIKEIDTITINASLKDMEKNYWQKRKEGNGHIKYMPPLYQAVLKYKYQGKYEPKNTIQYIYFEVINNGLELEFYQYNTTKYIFTPLMYVVLTPKDGFEILNVYSKQINANFSQSLIFVYLYLSTYVNTIKNDPNTIIKKEKQLSCKMSTSNNKYSNKTVVISNNKIVYEVINKEGLNNIKRQYIKHIESFNVMGHTRKLKNGKIIYVRPYKKGVGITKKKEYVVK